MLRRAENVGLVFKPGSFSKRGWIKVVVGSRVYKTAKVSKQEFATLMDAQRKFPVKVANINGRSYWLFQDRYHWDNDDLRSDQVHALLVTRSQRQQGRIERAQAIVAMGTTPQPQAGRRDIIGDDVKQLVWMRDGGRCRHCGSQVELQFDHVIPVALGGSSHAQNLQILCGPCNRRKSAGLTVR